MVCLFKIPDIFLGVENGGFEQDPDGSLEIDHPNEIVNPDPEINDQNNEANINVFEAMLNEASEIEPGNRFFLNNVNKFSSY